MGDENVLSEQYLDDIFHCKLPKGLLWCLIFVKNLDNEKGKSVQSSKSVASVSPNVKDPRKRKKQKSKEREKKAKHVVVEDDEKEKSGSLGVEMDGGNLLGMLDNLEDSLKDQANIDDDGDT